MKILHVVPTFFPATYWGGPIWSTKAILNTIEICKPEMHAQLQAYTATIGTPEEPEARRKFFAEVENVSVDVALLEQADNVIVIRAKLIWDDIGSWRALERINPPADPAKEQPATEQTVTPTEDETP